MDEGQFFVIERAGPKGRIKLGPEAKAYAAECGLSVNEFAKHLLHQDAERQAGKIQRDGEN